MKKYYSAQHILNLINEAETAKGKRGKNAKDNTSDNKKAVQDIKSETDKMKGGKKNSKPVFGKRDEEDEIYDFNSSTLGYRFDEEPSQHWKDRVKAIALGYAGVEHQKNAEKEDYKKEGDYEGNKKNYDREKKKSGEIEKNRQQVKASGLKAREYPKDTFKSKTAFNEMKLVYKRTFTDEDELIDMLPESYTVVGNRFIVEDGSKTKYLVECKPAGYGEGFVDVHVTKKVCPPSVVNEAINKSLHLMEYSASAYQNSTSDYQLKEQYDNVKTMLDQVRSLQPQPDTNNMIKI